MIFVIRFFAAAKQLRGRVVKAATSRGFAVSEALRA